MAIEAVLDPDRHDAIRSIARFLLDERLDELTTTSLKRLDDEELAYGSTPGNPSWKRLGMRRTIELALSRLALDSIPESVARATEDVGRERAEQGFPLPALIHSFHLDLRVLWEAVLEEGRARGLTADPDFLDGLLLVWEATDANSVEVVDAYRRTERDLANRRSEIRARAFERLVLDGEIDVSAVSDASVLLGIGVDASVVAFVAEGVPIGDAAVSRCRQGLQAANLPFHLGWMGDELIGVVDRGRQPVSRIVELLGPLSEWRCGLANVGGLAAVPRAIRFARASIKSDLLPGVRPIDTHWVGALMAANDELAGAMARDVLGPLMALGERWGLLEALESYLREGSIAGVAAQTYRHRNTIRNRLRIVEEVTGLDLSRPCDTTILALATAWLKTPSGRQFVGSFE